MNQLEVMKREWEENLKQQRETVDAPQIENVVSMMSGVPVQRMAQAEGIRLKGMKEELKSRVIAQDKAVDTLVKSHSAQPGWSERSEQADWYVLVSGTDRCRKNPSGKGAGPSAFWNDRCHDPY